MTYTQFQIKNLSFCFPHKILFDDFNAQIVYGQRIAIIGRNGSGKTTLLKILLGIEQPTSGTILRSPDLSCGFVPQIVNDFDSLSGGQRFNAALTKALSLNPHALLLDEPTNHLDTHNRKSLMRMLPSYPGTLLIASHDTELLRNCIDTFWHIDDAQIRVFTGAFDDYIREIEKQRTLLTQEIKYLDRQKKALHDSLMKEQKRAAKSKIKGEKNVRQRKWPTIVSTAKFGRSEETSGRKKAALNQEKEDLTEQLSKLCLPEIIAPKFSLNSASISDKTIVSINDGSIRYPGQEPLLKKIHLSINSRDRVAIQGNNGCGKSTLVKAIMNIHNIIKSGNWHTPKNSDIGYLDQHYNTLSATKTVLETISERVPTQPHIEVRRCLNDFLFRKNEEVNTIVRDLSGGEKARLSLAQIAICTPTLLILDEITNNLDLETKEHVIHVLKAYPGAMIVISHDADFLSKIGINHYMEISNGTLRY